MTETEAYQRGLTDKLQERESLAAVLEAIERPELARQYRIGWGRACLLIKEFSQ